MKKFASSILALFILLSTPISAFSAEVLPSEQEQLIAKACSVFPEYADKIENQPVDMPVYGRSSNPRTLITTESREVSETETIIYSEYSDGIILLTDYTFGNVVTTNSSDTGAGATTVNIDIKATCTNISGYFLLENVVYTFISSAYDRIESVGTSYEYGKCSIHTEYPPILVESATQDAQIMYRLNFQYGPDGYYVFNSLLTFTVGNNSATVTHIDVTT